MNHNDVLSFLKTADHQSLPACLPLPHPPDELHDILTIAARVPDHGKYHPWYFIVLKDQARQDAGQMLRASFEIENPDTVFRKARPLRPSGFGVHHWLLLLCPAFEKATSTMGTILSSGAACYNLCLAANAMGYGSNWLTEWYSYSPIFKSWWDWISKTILPDLSISARPQNKMRSASVLILKKSWLIE